MFVIECTLMTRLYACFKRRKHIFLNSSQVSLVESSEELTKFAMPRSSNQLDRS